MSIARIELPEIRLTPEQNDDRRVHQLLTALRDALDGLDKHGVEVGPEAVKLTRRETD
jgi:hypothetical protein